MTIPSRGRNGRSRETHLAFALGLFALVAPQIVLATPDKAAPTNRPPVMSSFGICAAPCAIDEACLEGICVRVAPGVASPPAGVAPGGPSPTVEPDRAASVVGGDAEAAPSTDVTNAAAVPTAAAHPPAPPSEPPPEASVLLLLPYVGVQSLLGDTGADFGPGLRFGMMLGAHLNEYISLNGQLLFDSYNQRTGVTVGTEVKNIAVEMTFTPLFHFARNRWTTFVGPKLGVWNGDFDVTIKSTQAQVKQTYDGLLLGVNAGLFWKASSIVSIGVLGSVDLRIVRQVCISPTSVGESCRSSDLPAADKVAGLSAAALF